ncbi:MAG: putative outer membrane protein [Pseudoduganella sp.]|nr:putative outer membrane protein [Pseudoduganella sp.]
MPLLTRLVLASVLVGSLAGCAVKRGQYDVPDVPLPTAYPRAPAAPESVPTAAAGATASAHQLDQVLPEWWRLLRSPELDSLVARALRDNQDLRAAEQRWRQAQARAAQAGADRLPQVTASAQRRRESAAGEVGGSVTGGHTPTRDIGQVGLRADLRLDIWGERQAMYESADLQQWRARFLRDEVQRTVVANVVLAYLDYLSFDDRLRVAVETDAAVSDMLAAIEVRMEKGDATLVELEQQRAAVYAVKATIPTLELQRDEALNNLALQVGAVPGALQLNGQGLASLNFPTVLPGMPSALLLRRPDIRVLEARLLAADADIDTARTRLLPPLDLSAQAGYGSQYMSRLFEPSTLFWNVLASLSVTLFDHGKRDNEVVYSKAVRQELVETYGRTIYSAVREVDDALNGIRLGSRRLAAQRQAADASRRAWDYSRESYRAGAIDHLLLLDTERTYHRNLDEQHVIDRARYRALVNLFAALGGGVAGAEALPGKGRRPTAPVAGAGTVLDVAVPAAVGQPRMLGTRGLIKP